MSFLTDVTQRRRQPEIIDQPDLDPQQHSAALRGLERINWWSASAGILWPPLRRLAARVGPLRFLDLATGAGDVPIRLWHKARRAGLSLQIAGCDRSPHAVRHARERAEQSGAAVEFFEADALRDELPGDFDVIASSLFLHHLSAEEAVDFLRRMSEATQHLVLVNDLVRSRAGLLLAYAGTRILSASTMVHSDGPRSVAGAFTRAEARDLAERAGLAGVTVTGRWPCRYLLQWERPVQPAPVVSSY